VSKLDDRILGAVGTSNDVLRKDSDPEPESRDVCFSRGTQSLGMEGDRERARRNRFILKGVAENLIDPKIYSHLTMP
jgi:hypothetical protein